MNKVDPMIIVKKFYTRDRFFFDFWVYKSEKLPTDWKETFYIPILTTIPDFYQNIGKK